jgi:hypothetical protein
LIVEKGDAMSNNPGISGTPVLIDLAGKGQILEHVPLTPKGKSAFDEAWIQRLVHETPSCLPIAEIEPGLDPFTAICREMPTPRGFVDNLLMTGRGDIALVETKLFRNPEARRQALAQALDYATSLFAMSYEAFERAALDGSFAPREKPTTLYDALPGDDKLSEDAFADAVSRNLRRGRALILIAGDGIREEAEGLLDGLQRHARFGFTLALIELGVFRIPGSSGQLIVRPRTLAKTSIVRRTIVEVIGAEAPKVHDEELAAPETLSAENYWDALEHRVPGARKGLEKFIQDVAPLGVYPDFLKSLVLRWDVSGSKSVNLGYISKNGSIWTDLSVLSSPRELAHTYVSEVAAAFDSEVHTLPSSGNWTPYRGDRPLRLASVMDHLDAWIEPMRHFMAAINEHSAGAE